LIDSPLEKRLEISDHKELGSRHARTINRFPHGDCRDGTSLTQTLTPMRAV
jgi:hypothetical protein